MRKLVLLAPLFTLTYGAAIAADMTGGPMPATFVTGATPTSGTTTATPTGPWQATGGQAVSADSGDGTSAYKVGSAKPVIDSKSTIGNLGANTSKDKDQSISNLPLSKIPGKISDETAKIADKFKNADGTWNTDAIASASWKATKVGVGVAGAMGNQNAVRVYSGMTGTELITKVGTNPTEWKAKDATTVLVGGNAIYSAVDSADRSQKAITLANQLGTTGGTPVTKITKEAVVQTATDAAKVDNTSSTPHF